MARGEDGRKAAQPARSGVVQAPDDERTYRVFISYSHQDVDIVRVLEQILRRNGFDPMWDQNFAFGQGFHDQIRNFIAHAHAFLPVLTETSDRRKWVHQEIGYAMALNVPVLPVAIGPPETEALPGEMIQHLHAIRIVSEEGSPGRLSGANRKMLRQILTVEAIERLVERSVDPHRVPFACADYQETRAAMMAQHADDVRALGRFGAVRQKGALSSFHIPTETIGHRVWLDRYGGVDRGDEHCRLQRRERLALTRHAGAAGCRLIIDPSIKFERWGEEARLVRLRGLLSFLRTMPDDRCQVAISPQGGRGWSVTYVGNWFAAESRSAVIGKGYYQTIFTRHAPWVTERIADFDAEFNELLAAAKVEPHASRLHAIRRIEREIRRPPARTGHSVSLPGRPRGQKLRRV